MTFKKNKAIYILLLAFAIGLLAVLLKDLYPLILEVVKNKHDENLTIKYVENYGNKGIPILIMLIIISVLIPILPTTLIQVVVGLCYHSLIGVGICLIGLTIGNLIIFLSFKYLNTSIIKIDPSKNKIINKILPPEKQDKLNPLITLFILYLIPVVPNIVVTFALSSKKINILSYVITVALASLPSVLFLTFIGQHLSNGDYKHALILIIIILLIILCIYYIIKKRTPEKN